MSYNTELQEHNAELQSILAIVNDLPESGYGQLEYVLSPSGDDTDRSQDILNKLTAYGVVFLRPGNYTVNSTVVLPIGTSVIGAGQSTDVKIGDSVVGSAFQCSGNNNVSGLKISGSLSTYPSEVGSVHGIYVPESSSLYQFSSIIGEGIPGAGIYVEESGYYPLRSTIISDCAFRNCGVGIYFGKMAEYAMVSNTSCTRCLYGCINNGGNNKFSACGFDGNDTNFCIDGSVDAFNNGHGTAVGCTFNHAVTSTLTIDTCQNGFTFTGCQFFDGTITVKNSYTILFEGSQFKIDSFSIAGGVKSIVVDDCVFATVPTISVDSMDRIWFSNCYSISGEEILNHNRFGAFQCKNISIPGSSSVVLTLPAASFAMFATSATTTSRKSAVLLWGGNATNAGLKATISSLLDGSDVEYTVGSTSGAYNTVTVTNKATSALNAVLTMFAGKVTWSFVS